MRLDLKRTDSGSRRAPRPPHERPWHGFHRSARRRRSPFAGDKRNGAGVLALPEVRAHGSARRVDVDATVGCDRQRDISWHDAQNQAVASAHVRSPANEREGKTRQEAVLLPGNVSTWSRGFRNRAPSGQPSGALGRSLQPPAAEGRTSLTSPVAAFNVAERTRQPASPSPAQSGPGTRCRLRRPTPEARP